MLAEVREVRIGSAVVGGGAPLALIAGPCVLEGADHALRMAEGIRAIADRLGVDYVFKASFDKANRTSADAPRGPGPEEGLRMLARVRAEAGVPVLSDIHAPDQAAPAAEVLDALQIPAFLCRQTDLLAAAAATGRPVAVKKGQFLAPWDMRGALGKCASAGDGGVLLVERGTSFGYNNLVSDMRSPPLLRELGAPVVFDATHSVQLPGGQGDASGGERRFVGPLSRAAAGAGVDALFLEVHDDPDRAPCDGPNMVPLDRLEHLLAPVVAIDRLVRERSD